MAARVVPCAPRNYFVQFEMFLILFDIFLISDYDKYFIWGGLSILNSLFTYLYYIC